MKHKQQIILVVAFLALTMARGQPAAAQSGGPFAITSFTVDTGGGGSPGGPFVVDGTIGQYDASRALDGRFLRGARRLLETAVDRSAGNYISQLCGCDGWASDPDHLGNSKRNRQRWVQSISGQLCSRSGSVPNLGALPRARQWPGERLQFRRRRRRAQSEILVLVGGSVPKRRDPTPWTR